MNGADIVNKAFQIAAERIIRDYSQLRRERIILNNAYVFNMYISPGVLSEMTSYEYNTCRMLDSQKIQIKELKLKHPTKLSKVLKYIAKKEWIMDPYVYGIIVLTDNKKLYNITHPVILKQLITKNKNNQIKITSLYLYKLNRDVPERYILSEDKINNDIIRLVEKHISYIDFSKNPELEVQSCKVIYADQEYEPDEAINLMYNNEIEPLSLMIKIIYNLNTDFGALISHLCEVNGIIFPYYGIYYFNSDYLYIPSYSLWPPNVNITDESVVSIEEVCFGKMEAQLSNLDKAFEVLSFTSAYTTYTYNSTIIASMKYYAYNIIQKYTRSV